MERAFARVEGEGVGVACVARFQRKTRVVREIPDIGFVDRLTLFARVARDRPAPAREGEACGHIHAVFDSGQFAHGRTVGDRHGEVIFFSAVFEEDGAAFPQHVFCKCEFIGVRRPFCINGGFGGQFRIFICGFGAFRIEIPAFEGVSVA